MRAEPWPITCRARSRSRVPPASTRPRGTLLLVTASTAAVVPRFGPAAAAVQVRDGGAVQARGGGDGAVGAAVLAQAADVRAGRARAGGRVRRAGLARDGTGRGVDAHCHHRLRAGSRRSGLGGAAGGVQGAGDLGIGQAGLAGGVGQRAEVGGGVSFQGAVGGPVQARVAVAFRLGGDPAGQVAQIRTGCLGRAAALLVLSLGLQEPGGRVPVQGAAAAGFPQDPVGLAADRLRAGPGRSRRRPGSPGGARAGGRSAGGCR